MSFNIGIKEDFMATAPSHVLRNLLEEVEDTDFREWVKQEVADMNSNSCQTEASRVVLAGSYRITFTITNEDNEE